MALLMGGFLALIIAAALITPLSESGNKVTTLTSAIDTIDISPARLAGGTINTTYPFIIDKALFNGWRAANSECEVQTITFKNSTGATMTDPTQYVFVMDVARLTLKNVNALNNSASNTTTASYSYCPEGYVTSSWGRMGINTTMGFFALAALMASVGMFYALARKNGIFG